MTTFESVHTYMHSYCDGMILYMVLLWFPQTIAFLIFEASHPSFSPNIDTARFYPPDHESNAHRQKKTELGAENGINSRMREKKNGPAGKSIIFTVKYTERWL
uniref:Uncharacterized protein n=1 Tax=Lotharella globosa TaxID=91324 RepID=A0A7S3YIS1_9EUKA